MNRSQLTRIVAEKLELDPKLVTDVYTAVVDNILESLAEGETVTLKDFGTFSAPHSAERVVRNPRTQQPVTVPAHLRPVFKFGESARKAVNTPRP